MKKFFSLVLLMLAGLGVHAEVRLAHIFTDHAVLQRDKPIVVWGWARSGEAVQVQFDRERQKTRANAQGEWRVSLRPHKAGGPFELSVRGDNRITLRDVVVGEVWLASGQSNMQWALADAQGGTEEVARSAQPMIRHFTVPRAVSLTPLADVGAATWQPADPAHSGAFSAVGYHFAKILQAKLKVPVGIVNNAWGGTHVETWISRPALLSKAEYGVAALPDDTAGYLARYQQRMARIATEWQKGLPLAPAGERPAWHDAALDDSRWSSLQVPLAWEEQGMDEFDGVVWYRREVTLSAQQAAGAAVLHLGTIDDRDETWVNGQRVGASDDWDAVRRYAVPAGVLHAGRNVIAVRVQDDGGGGGFYGEEGRVRLETAADAVPLAGAWRARVEGIVAKTQPGPNDLPTLLFNGMVHPLIQYGMRGVIWYQGESNVARAEQYRRSFPLLIQDWRAQWRAPDMPFYFVQLASFLPLEKNTLAGSTWAELRDAQRQTLAVPHTGMAVTIDVGNANDIHPRDKLTVGQRLARQALKHDYGFKNIQADGPVLRAVRPVGATLVAEFVETGHALAVRGAGELRGFAIADASRKFVPAQARIEGKTVVVSSPLVSQPLALRYGWVDNPELSNLVDDQGLPASPFRSDDWPWLSAGVKFLF